jgi:hypothetical protein
MEFKTTDTYEPLSSVTYKDAIEKLTYIQPGDIIDWSHMLHLYKAVTVQNDIIESLVDDIAVIKSKIK